MIPIETIRLKYDSEIALILLCCRVHFNTENQERLQQFINNNPVDWDHLQYLASYHRIEPIVYAVLERALIPAGTAAQIRQKRLFLIKESYRHALEAERIITLLNANSIRCIPYKGVAFSKQFYGDVVSRVSSDIDLVIDPKNFGKVMVLMKQHGYSFGNQLDYTYFEETIFKERKDLSFNRYNSEGREFHVEFHWRITDNRFQIKKQANALLSHCDRKEVLVKNSVEVLNNNSHYLAVFIHHSINDSFCVLRNIVDICQLCKNTPANIDVKHIEELIFDFGLNKAAGICGYLSEELLGVKLPFSQCATADVPKKVQKYFTEQLLQKSQLGKHFVAKIFNKSILHLKNTSAEKINYLLACLQFRFIPSPKDIRIFNLPKKLSFLYIILKPFRSLISRSNHEEEKRMAQQQHQAFLSSETTNKK